MNRHLILATGNRGKINEMKELLVGLPLCLVPMNKITGLPPLEEDQPTFAGNAAKKAETIARSTGDMALADDSGLCVNALDGRPGVYSARFAGPDAGDEENNRLLLELLQDIPPGKRQAEFRCAIAVAMPCGKTYLVEESCPGRISGKPRGQGGFGYDPLFICDPGGVTFAEMNPLQKNEVSHRGKAMRKVRDLLERLTGSFD